MINLVLIIFAITLLYLSIAERFSRFATLIAVQGFLLFVLTLLKLGETDIPSLIFVIAETLLFKAIILPIVLRKIIRQTKISRVHDDAMPAFYTLILVLLGMAISLLLAFSLTNNRIQPVFLTVAIFTLYTGMILIIGHKRIFSHMIGFLVLENAVFLFSLAIGGEMPMLINIGILLDIFASVLILGLFLTKIGQRMNEIKTEGLTRLKD